MPILHDIIERIKENISGLTVAGGYNYNWGTVQERDVNKMQFPAAVVHLPDDEQNLDDPNGVHALSYYNRLPVHIQIYDELATQTEYPEDEIRLKYFTCLDDLKKVFGTDFFLNGNCEKIMYRGARFVKARSGDLFTPATLMSRWDVYYLQDRENPNVNGG